MTQQSVATSSQPTPKSVQRVFGRNDEIAAGSKMLCSLCQLIDFSGSPLYREEEADFLLIEDGNGTEYLIYRHQPSIQALQTAAAAGCHFCSHIRQELFNVRGHERDEAVHNGPIEMRYFPQVDTHNNLVQPKMVVVVAKTPIRNVKLYFYIVQYDCKSSLT
jgi:hypothetical protein